MIVIKTTPDKCERTHKLDIVSLVDRVRSCQPAALEELYGLVRNFTFFLMRQLGGEDLQDKIHDVFLAVAQAIIAGKLRDPRRLIPFVTTLTRFYTYSQIESRVTRRRFAPLSDDIHVVDSRMNLEQNAYSEQKAGIARDILRTMPERHGDVLRRFYVEEQTKEQICREMDLTPTQFRLLKSKAKSNFAKLAVRRLRCCRMAA